MQEYDGRELSSVLLNLITRYLSILDRSTFEYLIYIHQKITSYQIHKISVEGCGFAMKDILLPLKSGSDSSQADQEAKDWLDKSVLRYSKFVNKFLTMKPFCCQPNFRQKVKKQYSSIVLRSLQIIFPYYKTSIFSRSSIIAQ